MLAVAQKLLDSHSFNRTLDRVLFLGGAVLLAASVGFAAISFFVA
ncbi:MAG: hypothetical protein ABI459_10080 [Deltaproteobacteria bacterium]